ncbi:MAG: LytTR family transcriptional regulator [Caulobacteraceae bacterium]|nr:LytTR family transcriptional regulator [Caulobacteraceae bacterium]
MKRGLPFPALMTGFAAYSYGATALSAAWFLRRDFGLTLWPSIGWAALLFSPWVAVGLMVWAVLRLLGDRAKSMGILAVLAVPVVPLAGLTATAVDGAMRGANWSGAEVLNRSIDRLPVAILLYTALVAAGLAAAWWRRTDLQRREMEALRAALDAVRTEQAIAARAPDAPTPLIVSVGRGRAPVLPADIEWVSSAGNYAVVHWRDQEGLLREPLQQLEARLVPAGFARAHRSTLINLAHVAELRPLADGAWRATLDSGAELVISRSYRDAVLARLGRR